jgi:hypothetical protein
MDLNKMQNEMRNIGLPIDEIGSLKSEEDIESILKSNEDEKKSKKMNRLLVTLNFVQKNVIV